MNQIISLVNIAIIKLFHNKEKNILILFSISVTSLSLLSLIIGTSGVNSLLNNIAKDSLKGRYFAYTNSFDNDSQKDDLFFYKKPNTLEKYPDLSIDPINNYLEQNDIQGYWFSERDSILNDKKTTFKLPPLTSKDDLFLQDLLSSGYTLGDNYNGKIPIILQDNTLMQLENYNPVGDNQQVYKFLQSTRSKYLGKTFSLSRFNPKTSQEYFQITNDQSKNWKGLLTPVNIQVVVVGFGLSQTNSSGFDFLVPHWGFERIMRQEVVKLNTPVNYTHYYEFKDKDTRDKVVQESIQKYTTSVTTPQANGGSIIGTVYNQNTLQPYIGRSEYLENIVFSFQQLLFYLSIFLLVISCILLLSYMSRIILESKQEIGIMRAVGAKKSQIMWIYAAYVWLVSTIGFISGLLLSLFVNAILSQVWGESIYYAFIPFATNGGVEIPKFVLIGNAFLPVLGVYLAFNVVLLIVSLPAIIKASKIDPIRAIREN